MVVLVQVEYVLKHLVTADPMDPPAGKTQAIQELGTLSVDCNMEETIKCNDLPLTNIPIIPLHCAQTS